MKFNNRLLNVVVAAFLFFHITIATAINDNKDNTCNLLLSDHALTKFTVLDDLVKSSFYDSELVQRGYFQFRGIYNYGDQLGIEFIELISEGDAIWLDSGGGFGNAIVDFLSSKNTGKTTLVTLFPEFSFGAYVMEDIKNDYTDRFHYFRSDYLENISGERLSEPYGKYSVVSDFYGAMSYSVHPDKVLRNIFDSMKVGGKLFLVVGAKDSKFNTATEIVPCFDHEIVRLPVEGDPFLYTETSLLSWLTNNLTGFDYKLNIPDTDESDAIVLVLTKNNDPFYLPKLKPIDHISNESVFSQRIFAQEN